MRVGVIPSSEVHDSFAHPKRRGNCCQNRHPTRLDRRPEAAYHAAGSVSSHDASREERRRGVVSWAVRTCKGNARAIRETFCP